MSTRHACGCVVRVAGLAVLAALNVSGAQAGGSAPAPLPPAAQAVFDSGIEAARSQDYASAVSYLQQARQLAPQSPAVFRSLGAVESRMPGRELRALAWYGAYLAAAPATPDVAEIVREIDRLREKSLRDLSGLLRTLQAVSNLLTQRGDFHSQHLHEMPALWLTVGEIANSQAAASALPTSEYRDPALRSIGQAQLAAGDVAGAQKSEEAIQGTPTKLLALSDIVEAQALAADASGVKDSVVRMRAVPVAPGEESDKAGALLYVLSRYAIASARDTADARKIAKAMPEEISKWSLLGSIAAAEAATGDTTAANKTIESISDPWWRSSARTTVALDQARRGDIDGARRAAEGMPDELDKGSVAVAIARAQLKVGDIAGARRTVDALPLRFVTIGASPLGWDALVAVAEAQAKAGDAAGARKAWADLRVTASQLRDADARRQAEHAVARGLGEPPRYADWTDRLDDSDKVHSCALNTSPFLDLAGNLKQLKDNPTPGFGPEHDFDLLYETADQIAKAWPVINLLLAEQGIP